MMTPIFPDWGGEQTKYLPWHYYTGPHGDMHAGHVLDTVIAPDAGTGKDRVYEILRCQPCIAIHATPLPSYEELGVYYSYTFFQVEKPEYLTRYDQDRAWWKNCVHGPLLEQAETLLGRRDHPPRILEIGAGPGVALDEAATRGWATTAIEPSPVCVDYLRLHGHSVFPGTLEDYTGEFYNQWDCIYLYEVLEHQRCPEDFLLRCYDLLAPGGVIVICVPNDASPVQDAVCEKLGIRPYWWAPPQHLFYFSPKFLQLLVRRCGFTICDIRGTYPLERFILDEGMNYLGNDEIGRRIHTMRMEEELFVHRSGLWAARQQQYRRQMAEHRLGREIVLIARKDA